MEEDIEGLKRLFYANALTQYGKRKIISYYEQRYKELEKNYKNQIKHTTILAKALGLEEDAPIDEIYAEINKLKANSIPTSVIQKKKEDLNGNREYLSKFKDWKEKDYTNEDIIDNCIEVLDEILEEGRK